MKNTYTDTQGCVCWHVSMCWLISQAQSSEIIKVNSCRKDYYRQHIYSRNTKGRKSHMHIPYAITFPRLSNKIDLIQCNVSTF